MAEFMRRVTLYDKAQEICRALTAYPNIEESEPLLKLAEELRGQLALWIWPE